MKTGQSNKSSPRNLLCAKESPLKVINTYKSKGVIQIRVKVIQKSQSVNSLNKTLRESPLNFQSVSVLSNPNPQSFTSQKANTAKVSPGDFLEPFEDLKIPSSIEYISKHNPTKSMSEVVISNPSLMKPPRPKISTTPKLIEKGKGKRQVARKNLPMRKTIT